MIELLSPVGDFNCLKAAVQNGSDAIYFGAESFSARAFASNFSGEDLKKAICYAKLRGVKTNLTLNTLVKDDEFEKALYLAETAYEYGIDAIIVQDLGLAMKLIHCFPDLPIHASTQMTVHNLNGALELQELGFKRIVLARELTMDEISYISKNTNVEIECFVHGALCISYSGQCLFSSMLGGRSGNRGKCAGTCRLPYTLLENDKKINSGYLLSTRDLCGLDYIPSFLSSGVKCLKIEGRMKSPEYVATVTRIYRKYIDLALSNKPYKVEESDKKELMQVFNRGMSSHGHLDSTPNRNLVFKDKPNHMGLFLGIVQKYNKNKGYVTLKLKEPIEIGDTISFANESGSYAISELMDEKFHNISETKPGQLVVIGRMKGNIHLGDKIYKISAKYLLNSAKQSFQKENRKIGLNCVVNVKKGLPINISITAANGIPCYQDLSIFCELPEIPVEAKNKPLDSETIIRQISKTASTPYEFKNIEVHLDNDVFLPKISALNELRRISLKQVETYALSKITRTSSTNLNDIFAFFQKENEIKNLSGKAICESTLMDMRDFVKNKTTLSEKHTPKISVLLNLLQNSFDYSKLSGFDNLYIPLKYFTNRRYSDILTILCENFDTYIYMPTILKGNYKNLCFANIESAVQKYKLKGFVVSNICNIRLLNELFENLDKYFKLIANYTFNVFNLNTELELKKLGISKFTISPELDQKSIHNLCDYQYLQKELIVYGKTPLMNMNYCLLGETDKCYPECKTLCHTDNVYYLKDRMNMKFRVLPDNIQTVTTIYNSKTTSISWKGFCVDCARIDFLDESIEEMNHVIQEVKAGRRLEGTDFTNGNLNREI